MSPASWGGQIHRGVGLSPQPWVKWGVQSIPGWVCGQDLEVEQRWGVHGHREPWWGQTLPWVQRGTPWW